MLNMMKIFLVVPINVLQKNAEIQTVENLSPFGMLRKESLSYMERDITFRDIPNAVIFNGPLLYNMHQILTPSTE